MKRAIIKDISVHEMFTMRRQGMSNRAIADALDIALSTVYTHIGKQGKLPEPSGEAASGHQSTQERSCPAPDRWANPPVTGRTQAAEVPVAEAPQRLELFSTVLTPVRVVREFAPFPGCTVATDGESITITGAERMSAPGARRLARLIMHLTNEPTMAKTRAEG